MWYITPEQKKGSMLTMDKVLALPTPDLEEKRVGSKST
jgi:hypothetical protein